jgi:hypothetical protein
MRQVILYRISKAAWSSLKKLLKLGKAMLGGADGEGLGAEVSRIRFRGFTLARALFRGTYGGIKCESDVAVCLPTWPRCEW